MREAHTTGVQVAKRTEASVVRQQAYKVVHFGLRKGGSANKPMPDCVADNVRLRFPETGTTKNSVNTFCSWPCLPTFFFMSAALSRWLPMLLADVLFWFSFVCYPYSVPPVWFVDVGAHAATAGALAHAETFVCVKRLCTAVLNAD